MSHHQLLLTSGEGEQYVKLFSGTIQKINSIDPQDAYAGIRYNNAGSYPRQQVAGTTLSWTSVDSWCLQYLPGSYEFLCTVVTGPNTPTGTLNTWLNASLFTGPNWYLAKTDVGLIGTVLSIRARLAATSVVVASSILTLRAQVS